MDAQQDNVRIIIPAFEQWADEVLFPYVRATHERLQCHGPSPIPLDGCPVPISSCHIAVASSQSGEDGILAPSTTH
jgi:hypothetical protein